MAAGPGRGGGEAEGGVCVWMGGGMAAGYFWRSVWATLLRLGLSCPTSPRVLRAFEGDKGSQIRVAISFNRLFDFYGNVSVEGRLPTAALSEVVSVTARWEAGMRRAGRAALGPTRPRAALRAAPSCSPARGRGRVRPRGDLVLREISGNVFLIAALCLSEVSRQLERYGKYRTCC